WMAIWTEPEQPEVMITSFGDNFASGKEYF
ncbi:unnamed protein product, partial [marine sediment metagenome]